MAHLTTALVKQLAILPENEKRAVINQLSPVEIEALVYDWRLWARDKQLVPDGDWWEVWAIIAGRGYGKTRTGAETTREMVNLGYRYIALVGRTAADVRNVMIEGESGLLSVFPKSQRPGYQPSKRQIRFHTGAIGFTYSGDKPDQLRGPQHDFAWCDEVAAWRYPESWDQVQFGLRLGKRPLAVVTTTPRPTPLMKSIIKDKKTALSSGSTFENAANLAPSALAKLKRKYENTRLGQQELYAIILDDVPGALWKRQQIEDLRVTNHPELVRVVVAIDPQAIASSDEETSETGIVVAALGVDGHGYILDDLTVSETPSKWARQAIAGYHKYKADRLIGEVNNGGDMIETVIRTEEPNIAYSRVRASRGKATRAEPISALYEQGRVHHVGMFAELEDQMCTWVQGDKSPDRMDAMVWALTELMLDGQAGEISDEVLSLLSDYRG
jgi:phage terminase large subunit-like protein